MKDEVNTLGAGKRNRKQDNNKYYDKQDNHQRNLKKKTVERKKDKPLILNLTGILGVLMPFSDTNRHKYRFVFVTH